jgi:hypothetical protein
MKSKLKIMTCAFLFTMGTMTLAAITGAAAKSKPIPAVSYAQH